MIHGIYFNYKDIEGKEEKILKYLKDENITNLENIYMASPLFSYIYDRIDKKYHDKNNNDKIRLASVIYSNNFEKINNEIDTQIDNKLEYIKLSNNKKVKSDVNNGDKLTKIPKETLKKLMEKQVQVCDKNNILIDINNFKNIFHLDIVFDNIENYLDKHISEINDFILYIKKTIINEDMELQTFILNDDIVYKLFHQILYRNYMNNYFTQTIFNNTNESIDILKDDNNNFKILNKIFYNILSECKNIDKFYDLFNKNLILDGYMEYLFENLNKDEKYFDKVFLFFNKYEKIKEIITTIYMEFIIKDTMSIKKLEKINKSHFIAIYYTNRDLIIDKINNSYGILKKEDYTNNNIDENDLINKIKEAVDKVIYANLKININFDQNEIIFNFLLNLMKLYTAIPYDTESDYKKIDLINELKEISNIVIFNKLDSNNIEKNNKYIENKYDMFKIVTEYVKEIKEWNTTISPYKLTKKKITKLCIDLNEIFDIIYDNEKCFSKINDNYIKLIIYNSLNNELIYNNNNDLKVIKNLNTKTELIDKLVENNKKIDDLLIIYKKVSNELLTNNINVNIIFSVVNNNSSTIEKMYKTFSNLINPNNDNKKILNNFVLVILENIFNRKSIFENILKIKKINNFIFYDPIQFLYINNLILSSFNNMPKGVDTNINCIVNNILKDNGPELDKLLK